MLLQRVVAAGVARRAVVSGPGMGVVIPVGCAAPRRWATAVAAPTPTGAAGEPGGAVYSTTAAAGGVGGHKRRRGAAGVTDWGPLPPLPVKRVFKGPRMVVRPVGVQPPMVADHAVARSGHVPPGMSSQQWKDVLTTYGGVGWQAWWSRAAASGAGAGTTPAPTDGVTFHTTTASSSGGSGSGSTGSDTDAPSAGAGTGAPTPSTSSLMRAATPTPSRRGSRVGRLKARIVGDADGDTVPPARRLFAVIGVGGSQYKVTQGDVVNAEHIPTAPVGSVLNVTNVLAVGSATRSVVGRPTVPGVTVRAAVEEVADDAKVIVFKKRRRKRYTRTNGHRRMVTRLRIVGIDVDMDAY